MAGSCTFVLTRIINYSLTVVSIVGHDKVFE